MKYSILHKNLLHAFREKNKLSVVPLIVYLCLMSTCSDAGDVVAMHFISVLNYSALLLELNICFDGTVCCSLCFKQFN